MVGIGKQLALGIDSRPIVRHGFLVLGPIPIPIVRVIGIVDHLRLVECLDNAHWLLVINALLAHRVLSSAPLLNSPVFVINGFLLK